MAEAEKGREAVLAFSPRQPALCNEGREEAPFPGAEAGGEAEGKEGEALG